MERVNRILKHPGYQEYVARNERAEASRRFCHHTMEHFLDVARLAVILNLTENLKFNKELIYAAALLHDIGRWMQYEEEIPHEKASAMLAPDILTECGFSEDERRMVIKAIADHRNAKIREEKSLSGLLYRADKLSRPCYVCKMEQECSWKQDKKNKALLW